MIQVINTNSSPLLTQSNLNRSQSSLSSVIERLSFGLHINDAKDDAAGQATANHFTSGIKGLTQTFRNANNGISIAQTTEGSLPKINNNLQRVCELVVQSSTGTNSQSDLDSIQAKITQRPSEIGRVSDQTQFNSVKVLAKDNTLAIQVGANDDEIIGINLQEINSKTLGLGSLNIQQKYKAPDVVADFGYRDKAAATIGKADMAAALTVIKTRDAVAIAVAIKGEVQFDAESNKYYAELDVMGGAATTSDVYEVKVATNGKVILAGADRDALPKVIKDIKSYQEAVSIDPTNAETALVKGGADNTDAGTIKLVKVSLTDNNDKTTDGGYTPRADSSKYCAASIDDSKAVSIREIEYIDKNGRAMTAAVQLGGINDKTEVANVGGKDYLAEEVKDHNLKAEPKLNEVATATTDSPLAKIDAALTKVADLRSDLGAIQNRLNSTIISLGSTVSNLSEVRSHIEDTDYVTETSNVSHVNILQQVDASVLVQADQTTQNALSLLH